METEFDMTFKCDAVGRKDVAAKWKGCIEWEKWIKSMKTHYETGIRLGTKTAEKNFWKNSEIWKLRDYESKVIKNKMIQVQVKQHLEKAFRCERKIENSWK